MSTDVHSLIAPYALDALEADDRSRFEAHLVHCEQCRVELAGFLATAARLGEVEEMPPPPGLRQRLAAMVATTPQERPIGSALADRRGRMHRFAPRIGLVAATVVAMVGIGGFIAEHERAEDLSADRSRMTSVMSAPDAATTKADVNGGGQLRVIASDSADAAVVIGASLNPVGPDRTYQVWRMRGGKPTSAGLLGRGPGLLYVDGLKGAEAFAVSVEPAGGSPAPTTDPIAVTPL